jgi:hypothetical protein
VPIGAGSAATLTAGSNIRFGEEAATASSLIIGKSLKSWTVRLRKQSSPSGNVIARVRRKSGDTVVATFSPTINSTTLNTSFQQVTFTLTTPYIIKNGDRILVEYSGPNGVQIEITTVDAFNGANTRRVGYVNAYTTASGNAQDITGTMSSV